MPFLTVITRTFRRPSLLTNNQRSLADQTDPDYEQIIIRDEVGRGVAWANAHMRTVGPIRGEYVMALDDDDILVDPCLIADLKRMISVNRPAVIITRMDHGPRGILPPPDGWGHPPPRGQIGCSAPIVRVDVWQACAPAYGESYDGDYDFIAALFAQAQPIVWHNKIVSAVQQIGLGRPEHA